MTEKLSREEFDSNYSAVLTKLNNSLKKVNKTADDVILLAATKTVDVNTINYAISKGISYIGENKVQELLLKNSDIVPVRRHFIGHLQTNKVKDIIDKVEMIESVHSIKLAREISKQAEKHGITMDILVEVNIGKEDSKSGFFAEDLASALEEIAHLPNIRIKGLMAIPPICENSEDNRPYFQKMYKLYVDIRDKKIDNSSIEFLSMGMSDDFDIAVEEGANIIRLGTALFGKRIYNK